MKVKSQQLLEANLWKLSFAQICFGSFLFISILVLFYEQNGLSLQQIFIIQSVSAVLYCIFEIPSGYLSDRWSRKGTLSLSALSGLCATAIYCISTSFYGFMVASCFIAISFTMYSGTSDALLYDTLLQLKREDEFRRIFGHQRFLRFLSEAISGVIAGILASFSIKLPFLLGLIPYALYFLTCTMLHEPAFHKQSDLSSTDELIRICKKAMIENKVLQKIILLTSILSVLGLTLFWFTQPFQKQIGLPIALFGVMHAVIVIAGAIASKYSNLTHKFASDFTVLCSIAFVIVGSYISIGVLGGVSSMFFFLLVRLAWCVLTPVTSDIINKIVSSNERATVMSITGFIFQFIFIITSPIMGYMADVFSIQTALLCMAAMCSIGIVPLLLMLQKIKHRF